MEPLNRRIVDHSNHPQLIGVRGLEPDFNAHVPIWMNKGIELLIAVWG